MIEWVLGNFRGDIMNNLFDIVLKLGSLITAITTILGVLTWLLNKIVFKPMGQKLDALDRKIDMNKKDDLRYTILSFASDLRNGVAKTRQEYETIFAFHDDYETLIEHLKEKNGYLETEMDYIILQYNKLKGD